MRWTSLAAFVLGIGALALLVNPALADGQAPKSPSDWDKLSGVLLQLLAVVLVVESALAALFQWRVYRMAFNARALKTPIMFTVGLLIVLLAGYDPMDQVLRAVTGTATTSWWGRSILTSGLSGMIIAGGSAGIFALLTRLGLRTPENAAEQAEQSKLGSDQAWLSIRATGAPDGTPIQIGIQELNDPDTERRAYFFDHAKQPPLAGTIDSRGWWERASASFTADAQRFPNYGGRKVTAGKHYRITATWQDGDRMTSVGVFRGQFASRAVIDLTVDVSKEPPA
jgi:hypothetical protein